MFIPWYTPTQGITVSTDSEVGSNDEVFVQFYDKDGNRAGAVNIYFRTPIKYKLRDCTPYITFSTLPTEKQKTWIIRYDYTKQRVVINCNEVEVLNVLLSGECEDTTWRKYWKKPTTQIKFSYITSDASDSYCISGNPGKQFTWGILGSVTAMFYVKLRESNYQI